MVIPSNQLIRPEAQVSFLSSLSQWGLNPTSVHSVYVSHLPNLSHYLFLDPAVTQVIKSSGILFLKQGSMEELTLQKIIWVIT